MLMLVLDLDMLNDYFLGNKIGLALSSLFLSTKIDH